MMEKYLGIINMPYQKNNCRKQMSLHDRAAQFMPFAALTGYSDMVKETSRLTSNKKELAEDDKIIIDNKLNVLLANIKNKPEAIITYFKKDLRKNGGTYSKIKGNLKKIDLLNNEITFTNNEKIKISDIIEII